MRHSLLAAALGIALGTLSGAVPARSAAEPAASKRAEAQVWIVDLVDAPLASFRGSPKALDAKGQPLAATDIAVTGSRKLDAASAGSKAYLGWLEQRHEEFLVAASQRIGRTLQPRFRYKVISNGMALALSAEEAAQLATLPGVAAVQPEEIQYPMTDAGPAWIGAEAVWNGTVTGSNVRTRGEGVVIGVIDTGINSTHPSFADVAADGFNHDNPRGRLFGQCVQAPARCTDKLIGIYDLTEEGARDGRDTNGHGTHVASTAGGNVIDSMIVAQTGNIPLRVSGVAPRANVIMYKACIADGNDGRGSCPGSATRAALEQAIVDQVDVVNYSIGGEPFDPWSAVRNATTDQSEVFLNARFAGVVNVVAAGNDGPAAGSVSSPSNAPWVLSVANVSHDRRFGNRLENLSGPGVPAGTVFEGVSLTGTTANARVVNAADFGFALCSRGDDLDFPPTGASNPFPAGTFNGEIVLCRRGVQSRVAKGFNVRAAGASGMVLYNDPASGEAIVSDDHFLAATHIGNIAGEQLAQLLAAARAQGGEVRGLLTATRSVRTGSGDVLSADSGRGPVQPTGGYLKPDLAAPGTGIIAADEGGNGLASLSGTSMASPHVAGAAALLLAANPSWTVAQVESALRTTALDDVLLPNSVTRATTRDAGAGRTLVSAAVRAGLFFNITRDQFVAADPQSIATAPGTRDPRLLNLPSLVDGNCFETCTFTRTVTALVDGGWRFSAPADALLRVTATPETFNLSSGQSQSITFTVDAGNPDIINTWAETRVQLVPLGVNPPAVATQIPVSVFADPGELPDAVRINADATHGFRDITMSGLRSLSNAAFPTSDLVRLEGQTQVLPVDPTEDDPYDLPSAGVFVKLIDLPTQSQDVLSEFGFVVEVNSATARDVDLYVGVDRDGDRAPDPGEEVCRSTSSGASEFCAAIYTHGNGGVPNTLWVLVQNFAATQAAGDAVSIRSAGLAIAPGPNVRLAVSGPGVAARGTTVPLRVSWSEPRMLRGETWVGFARLQLGVTAGAPIPIHITLASAATPSPIVLAGAKDAEVLSLAAGSAHDRIVVDVPPNASAMSVTTEGTGEVDLYLARDTAGSTGPVIAAAPPRGSAEASSIHAGATERVDLSGATLAAGRWYVTPVNSGTTDARITLAVDVTQGSATTPPGDNGYFNAARSGHGVYFHQIGELWAVIWYTYLQDGTPAWYIATGPRPASGGRVWSAPLLRFTWNGRAARSTPVGEAMVTSTATDRFVFSWQVDGTFGSEPLQPTGAIECAPVTGSFVSVAGSWYAPALPGYGFNILTTRNAEAAIAYLYDAAGNPRWLLGATTNPGRGVIDLTQYTGFCPLCAFSTIQGRVTGPMSRGYSGPSTAQSAVDAPFASPVTGRWTSSNDIEKLTTTLPCQATSR